MPMDAMPTELLVTLREARTDDLPFINAFNFSEGMDALASVEGVTVAVDADDDPVGFIRIAIGSSGNAFVNPVVTNPHWRGWGIGRMLMDHALAQHGTLRLVSRGSAIGFYRALGYEPCGWDEIDEGVSEDCAHCSGRKECGPLPMRSPVRASTRA